MTSTAFADIVVNFCGAASIVVFLGTARIWRRYSPIDKRLIFALGLVATLFIVRGLSWIQHERDLAGFYLLPAVFLPFGALILVEGLLRRHAPRILKVMIAGATALFAVAVAMGFYTAAWAFSFGLMAFQTLALFVLIWLVLTRNRAQLSKADNRIIDVYTVAAALLLPLIVTDFRDLLPDMPVRMAAIGVAALIYFGVRVSRSAATVLRCCAELIAMLVLALIMSEVVAVLVAVDETADRFRLAAVILAMELVVLGLVAGKLARERSRKGTLVATLAAADISSQSAFLAAAARHPVLESLMVLDGPQLDGFSHEMLRRIFAMYPVIGRSELQDEANLADVPAAKEEMTALLQTYGASHGLLLSNNPLRIALLDLPDMVASAETFDELRLVQRLAACVGDRAARHD